MSDRLTSASLPGRFGSGFAEWGRLSAPDMIAAIRKYAVAQKEVYEAILAADDADFRVETYVGVHVRKNKQVLQEGVPAPRVRLVEVA